ncbi:VirB6/TrbL-like conjugal transfer protein, CD1112 family [Alkalihalobacillus sp. LMS39]|uniref:VirB6/TrbL-like conjugal transfer protein, CD1112 family n=1 Tax=Alkalihalobacillus sp. LMS39 TaxID=2924032 RepID=UPI001FB40415|nr:CD0415/CD1112 family protein [Alkalihalobacillus sp. LMS39]UOE94774.1 CD0415/CD1112 family protein [Alkalihalobacillus sp. LMS39]
MIDAIEEWFLDTITAFVAWNLRLTHNLFTHSINTVQTQVSETPTEFSATLVETLREISDLAIMPVAGLLLTYVFCYEIYNLVVEKNRGNDFDTGQMFYLIFKTAIIILLITNSFDITLAFFDLGKWITNRVPEATLTLPPNITSSIVDSIDTVGTAFGMVGLSVIILIVTFFMTGIIYLVAWTRIITILLYISIAPLPFSTLMNRDWVGSIGQTYLKHLLALMLQGYFMLVCLIVYAGLLEKTVVMITEQSQPIFGLLLLLVSMAILTLTLTRTHTLAKSVVGVV